LKARVDLGDQTAEFIPFEVIRTAILTYFLPVFRGRSVASHIVTEMGLKPEYEAVVR